MLRLPPFRYHRPETVEQAVSLMGEYGGEAMLARHSIEDPDSDA